MRNSAISLVSPIRVFLFVATIILAVSTVSVADYLKMNPPPDVDKFEHDDAKKDSCWVTSASDLLAAAGYGDGNNVQQRADEIYDEICDNHLCDCNNSGWDDTAMQTWLQSNYNTWKNTNPYTVIKTFGNRTTGLRYPYSRTDFPQLIGNHLRICNFLSLSSSEPNCTEGVVGQYGHSTPFWGDDGEDINDINSNPTKLKVSDSDYWNISVPVQTYTWADYNNPNTADCNEGPGWYFNYNFSNKSSRYIDGYITLESTTDGSTPSPRVVTASARFNYNGVPNATQLRYRISSNKQILSYRTSIDWDTNNSPTFTEDTNWVRVYWDLSDHSVPNGSIVNVTAEIVVPYDDVNGNSITIDGLLWLPLLAKPLPGGFMRGRHFQLPGGPAMYAPNMCGGYVVCAVMIFSNPSGAPPPVGEYRWVLDYDYYQDPCNHVITFEPNLADGGPYYMGYFRFGHSYGFLMDDELQSFSDWKTTVYPTPPFPPLQQMTFPLNWTGQLPYPKGQDLTNPQPQQCGDPGTYYYGGDINKDCKVDWQDFAFFVEGWLGCTDPENPSCL